jgi:hypothetical protein
LDAANVGTHQVSRKDTRRIVFTGENPLSRFEAAESFGNAIADAVEREHRPHFIGVHKGNVHGVDFAKYWEKGDYSNDSDNLDKIDYSVNVGNKE